MSPGHSLDKAPAEVVEGDRYLHDGVVGVAIARPEEHNLDSSDK